MKTATLLLVLLAGAPCLAVPVSVSVVDDKGAPVAGADVQLQSFVQSSGSYSLQQTGQDGKATFEVKAPAPAAAAGGFIGIVAAFKAGFALGGSALTLQKPARIALVPAGPPISGTVLDAGQKPVAGAQVSLSFWRKGGAYVPMFLTGGPLKARLGATTDHSGNWTLAVVPPDVTANTSIFAPGFARAQAEVAPGAKAQTTLHPGALIQGRLLGLDGKPLGDVHVYAQPTNNNPGREGYAEDQTAPDGTFKLDGLEAGTYNVMFQLSPGASFVVAAQEGVSAAVGAPVKLADTRAVEGVIIGGKVTERGTGKGIEGIAVGVYGGTNPVSSAAVSSATTGKNGDWTLRTLPGQSRVYVMGTTQEFVREQKEQNLEIGPQGKTDLNFELSRATKITGRLVDENGHGVKTSSLVLSQKYDEFPLQSDDTGHFEAFGPKDGEVEVGHPRWNPEPSDEKEQWDVVGTTKFSVQTPLEIHLKRAQLTILEVGVFDEHGGAVEGAQVVVNVSTGQGDQRMMQPRALVSDKTGRAHLGDLRSDQTASLQGASKTGFDLAPLPPLQLQNGVYRADITLNRRSGHAAGEVRDARGALAAKAQVFDSGVETESDAAGRFALAPLPAGKSDVVAWKDDGFALGSSAQAQLALRPQPLEPTDLARAKGVLDALREETKNTKYWNRDSLSLGLTATNFDTGAQDAQKAGIAGIYGLIQRFGSDPSVAPEKWIALLRTVTSPSDRLYDAALWNSKAPTLAANDATRGFLTSLENDAAQVGKAGDASNKWQNAIGLFGVAALAERMGERDQADALFDQADVFVIRNFPDKGDGNGNPSQDDIVGVMGELCAVSPRFLSKLVALVDTDSPAYVRLLSDGTPVVARINGLDAARPFLDTLKNAPPAKPDANGNSPSAAYSYGQAVTNSIRAGGQSNPKTALELARSLPKGGQGGDGDAQARALCEAARFQSPEEAKSLWSEALARLEPSEAMKFLTRLNQSDPSSARGFYETIRQNFDAQPAEEPNAMVYGRARPVAAFAFYEAQFAPARARYRLEKAFQEALKDPNGRYELESYARAMAVFDATRAEQWADQIGNGDNNFAGFEAKRRIARWLALDEAARHKASFGNRYGNDQEEF